MMETEKKTQNFKLVPEAIQAIVKQQQLLQITENLPPASGYPALECLIEEVTESGLPVCALYMFPTSVLSFQFCNNGTTSAKSSM